MEFITECLTSFNLTTCFICSASAKRNDRVCRFCWREFAGRTTKQITETKSFGHPQCRTVCVRYLYDWVPDKHPALSNLLIGLKGGASLQTWPKIAAEFVRHHFDQLHITGALIVPIPSRTINTDHAFLWAKNLAELTKLPFENPLRHVVEASQKGLSAKQRKAIQFDLAGTCSLGSHVVIADDIFTTGATAKAAVEAIGNSVKPPKTIEIWVLARRHRLAP